MIKWKGRKWDYRILEFWPRKDKNLWREEEGGRRTKTRERQKPKKSFLFRLFKKTKNVFCLKNLKNLKMLDGMNGYLWVR